METDSLRRSKSEGERREIDLKGLRYLGVFLLRLRQPQLYRRKEQVDSLLSSPSLSSALSSFLSQLLEILSGHFFFLCSFVEALAHRSFLRVSHKQKTLFACGTGGRLNASINRAARAVFPQHHPTNYSDNGNRL